MYCVLCCQCCRCPCSHLLVWQALRCCLVLRCVARVKSPASDTTVMMRTSKLSWVQASECRRLKESCSLLEAQKYVVFSLVFVFMAFSPLEYCMLVLELGRYFYRLHAVDFLSPNRHLSCSLAFNANPNPNKHWVEHKAFMPTGENYALNVIHCYPPYVFWHKRCHTPLWHWYQDYNNSSVIFVGFVTNLPGPFFSLDLAF